MTILIIAVVVVAAAGTGGYYAYNTYFNIPPPEKVTLTMWTHYTGNASDPIKNYIAEYQTLHPEITISYEAIDYEQLVTKIPAEFLAGNLPDIIHYGGTGDLAERGVISEAPSDIAQDIRDNFIELGVQGVTSNGTIWGYPDEAGNALFIYNEEMFQEAGITNPPTTWDEMTEDFRKLAKLDNSGQPIQLAMSIPIESDENTAMFNMLMMADGGDPISGTPPRVHWDSQAGIGAAKLIRSWIDNGYANPTWMTWQEGIRKEKIACAIVASWFGHWEIEVQDPAVFAIFRAVPIPYNPNQVNHSVSIGYNMACYVTSQSKHPRQAWDFLKWLNSDTIPDKTYTRMADQIAIGVGMPCCHKTSDHPLYHTTWLEPFVTALRTSGAARAMPQIKGGTEVQEILHRSLQRIWVENADVETTLEQAAQEANNILQENYPG